MPITLSSLFKWAVVRLHDEVGDPCPLLGRVRNRQSACLLYRLPRRLDGLARGCEYARGDQRGAAHADPAVNCNPATVAQSRQQRLDQRRQFISGMWDTAIGD